MPALRCGTCDAAGLPIPALLDRMGEPLVVCPRCYRKLSRAALNARFDLRPERTLEARLFDSLRRTA